MRDEVASDLVRDTYSRKKSVTWLTSSHEGDESTDLFLDMRRRSREEAEDRDFSFLYPTKVLQ